jgi:endonuclease YncB( thermonuclease family)
MLIRSIVVLVVAIAAIACQATAPTIPLPSTAAPLPTSAPRTSPPAQATQTVAPAVTLSVGRGPEGPTQVATVVSVTDGDTIRVDIQGTEYRLRYIGMDAPESVDPNRPIGIGGPEASVANKTLVGGKEVYLEKDVSETDEFGRLLRYVWLQTDGGWVMVDRELVLEGWARAKAYPPDTKYQPLLDEAQTEAQAAHVGIWSAAFATPLPILSGPAATGARAGCEPAYPTVCIPPPPPDLDCQDISFRRFTVLPPDPDNFDGDHNGIGCEADATP